MGRDMFGPGRGDWDVTWRGWWGDDPPYHAPVTPGAGERLFADVSALALEILAVRAASLVTHVSYRVPR